MRNNNKVDSIETGAYLSRICFPEVVKKIGCALSFLITDDKIYSHYAIYKCYFTFLLFAQPENFT